MVDGWEKSDPVSSVFVFSLHLQLFLLDRINRINRISNAGFGGRVSGVGEQTLANT